MKITQWIVLSIVTLTSNAFCIEWDAKQFELGAGVGFGAVKQENYNAGPVFSLAAGGNVPLLVEQHLRMTGLLSITYAPIYAQITDDIGGNFTSFNGQLLVEHDLAMGSKKAWFGLGLQASAATNFAQFQLLDSGYETTQDTLHFSAGLLSRLEIPITPVYSAALQAAYSPMTAAQNGISIGLLMHF